MESLEAVEGDSENLNESEYRNKNVKVSFDNRLSNEDNIAFTIATFRMAIQEFMYGGLFGRDDYELDQQHRDAKKKFVLDKLKRYGIDVDKLLDQVNSLKTGDFNYPPKEEKPDRGPFGV